MRKSLSFLLVSIFLISFVSASISVSPSEIVLDVMPGDIITKNITITTGGNLAVYLNATSEANITLNYSTPLIVESNKTIEVQFGIPTGIVLGSYDVYLTASTENTETTVTVVTSTSSSSSGGGTRTIYVLPNGSTTYIKPTENFTTTIIDLNVPADPTDPVDESETESETEAEMSTGMKVFILLVGISVLGGIGYAVYKSKFAVQDQVGEYGYE